MTTVTLSPKFQVVIPKEIREGLNLKSGMRIEMAIFDKHIMLIPMGSIKSMRGSLKGMDTTIIREPDREL